MKADLEVDFETDFETDLEADLEEDLQLDLQADLEVDLDPRPGMTSRDLTPPIQIGEKFKICQHTLEFFVQEILEAKTHTLFLFFKTHTLEFGEFEKSWIPKDSLTNGRSYIFDVQTFALQDNSLSNFTKARLLQTCWYTSILPENLNTNFLQFRFFIDLNIHLQEFHRF